MMGTCRCIVVLFAVTVGVLGGGTGARAAIMVWIVEPTCTQSLVNCPVHFEALVFRNGIEEHADDFWWKWDFGDGHTCPEEGCAQGQSWAYHYFENVGDWQVTAIACEDELSCEVFGPYDPSCGTDTITINVGDFYMNDSDSSWIPTVGGTTTITATITNNVTGYIKFTLYDVSDEPGYCMNAGNQSTTDKDLKFEEQEGFDISDGGAVATTSSPVSSATVTVTCYDYGAYGKIRAEATVCGCTKAAYVMPTFASYAKIPRDDNDNFIADAWTHDTCAGPPETSGAGNDDETNPPGAGIGDGFTRYEEYRGFMISGTHTRTDPCGAKDLFIHSELAEGIGCATDLPTATHVILDTEWSADRVVNFKSDTAHNADQRGIRVVERPYVLRRLYGFTESTTHPNLPTPNETIRCNIYVPAINEQGPPTKYTTDNDGDGNVFPPEDPEDTAIARATRDAADTLGVNKTIAHEIGHAIHIAHYEYVGGGRLTVMVIGFNRYADATWGNIPCTYDAVDEGQIKLH